MLLEANYLPDWRKWDSDIPNPSHMGSYYWYHVLLFAFPQDEGS
jgi:hypothetical protein